MTVNEVAKIIYEVNAAYCRAIGDSGYRTWTQALPYQKETIYHDIIFLLKHRNATVDELHENWLEKKEADGWSFGDVRDDKKKEHSCMLPFYDLKIKHRMKVHIFAQLVRSLKGWDLPGPGTARALQDETNLWQQEDLSSR